VSLAETAWLKVAAYRNARFFNPNCAAIINGLNVAVA
jgi:hypothetical protein